MFKKIVAFLKGRKNPILPLPLEKRPVFSTDWFRKIPRHELIQHFWDQSVQQTVRKFIKNELGATMDVAMDSSNGMNLSFKNSLPDLQVGYFSSQTFIGYQTCALLAQNWLIYKACAMPAKDAIRKGYDLTVDDDVELPPEVTIAIRKLDVTYSLMKHLEEFVRMGRVFGIRIAMFKVESDDPDYYLKPFNPDGVTPGSYRGIAQIDPYWITPELDNEAAADPASIHFYEPTWWQIGSLRVHRTHLVIMNNGEVSDILKPTYFFGGISVPQKISERVYAAERIANEAPQLALTKRTDVIKTDTAQALQNQADFEKRMQLFTWLRDNYGVKFLGLEEEMQRFDTTLTDLDALIMTQYQLVAAAANVPATKLLGTSPKGFNATGEFEEKSYHEELESIQAHHLTVLLDRHHLLLIRSEICPHFSIAPFTVTVNWRPVDSMTSKGLAEVNKLKADTAAVLVSTGAITGNDERERLLKDPQSGYDGKIDPDLEQQEEEEQLDPEEENI